MRKTEEMDTRERAERALRAGKAEDALGLYRALLAKVSVYEPGLYESWLEGAFAAYRALGRKQEAAYVSIVLGRLAEAERLLDRRRRPVEWALCISRQGRRQEAAEHLLAAGYPVLAAGERLAAGNLEGARELWERLLVSPRLQARPYESALVHLVLAGLDSKAGDAASSRQHGVSALQTLETLADQYETQGLRERAFDCCILILRIGKEHGSFENIAEGYTNAIRLQMLEHQRYFPLQYSNDFIADASASEEWEAAALAAHDAADHSRRMGLAFEKYYLTRAAELWIKAASASQAKDISPEVAENALSAALDAAATLGDLPMLGRIHGLLAGLPLSEERTRRHADLATRYGRAAENPPAGARLPDHLMYPNPYPDIGWQDLVEWELDGEPLATTALAVMDKPNDVKHNRLALRALLVGAAHDDTGAPPTVSNLVDLALALGNMETYVSLRPLERLFESESSSVRSAVMTGVSRILIKRSFVLVKQGLSDPDEGVRAEARRTLRLLHFADGLDPLRRVFSETRDQDVRETALAAIADIGSIEAGLFLLDVVRDGPDRVRGLALDRLAGFRTNELVPHVRATMELSVGPNQQALRSVLKALETVTV